MVVGFVASAFDLGPHAGHMQMLAEAKANCEHLIVGLHIDPSKGRSEKNRPIEPVSERYLKLRGCKHIDEIIPYETEEELRQLLCLLVPDIRFLGEEYQRLNYTGSDLGIQIHFCKRVHTVSSSSIRKGI